MDKTKKTTGIIYQAYNKQNGKSYIGQTVKSLKHRERDHYYQARDKNRENYKFQRALNKYFTEDWVWTVLEKDVPLDIIDDREMYYIGKFDSYRKGYNSTLGGQGTRKEVGESGVVYKLYHEDHGWVEKTLPQFAEDYEGIYVSGLYKVIYKYITNCKGWGLTPKSEWKKKTVKNKKI